VKSGDPDAMVVFSGDLLFPSSLSVATKGQHQAEIVEAIGAHVACLGNHGEIIALQQALVALGSLGA